VRFSFSEDCCRFAVQAMPISAPVVAMAGFGSRYVHAVQRVALAAGARTLVRDNQRLAFTTKDSGAETVTRGLNTHAATV
jgi:hypothetical protein